MVYEPFFGMNVLMTAEAIDKVAFVAGFLILFHLLFAAYFLYRFINPIKTKVYRTIA